MSNQTNHDVIVAGAGAAGLAVACQLAETGLKTAVISPFFPQKKPKGQRDPRTIALMQPSMRLLEHMGLWPQPLKNASSPLMRLRLLDDSGNLLDGTNVTFTADELSDEPFGWNVPLPEIEIAFFELAKSLGVEIIVDKTLAAPALGETVEVETQANGVLSAKIVIACDGRDSALRQSAGIGIARWSYDQVAIGAVFSHSAPHNDMSTECHKQDGPLTTVPMPDNHSSLVWMVRPERGRQLMALNDEEFAIELQSELHGELGLIESITDRKSFPMQGLNAMTYGKNRVFLVGEAAHVVPPIGAQGLNMSLRDGAMVCEVISEAMAKGADIGSDKVLAAYDSARRRDVWPRQKIIDLMNRSLLSSIPAFHTARALGLNLVNRIGPLRQKVMREGISPVDNLPKVMQG